MSEWWAGVEDLGLWSGIVALIISLYAATHARRSARAAERSAAAAERSAQAAIDTVSLRSAQLRQAVVAALEAALPDADKVTGLLADLPEMLRDDWLTLVTSASRRNARTPLQRFQELLDQHRDEWERAALSSPSLQERGESE